MDEAVLLAATTDAARRRLWEEMGFDCGLTETLVGGQARPTKGRE